MKGSGRGEEFTEAEGEFHKGFGTRCKRDSTALLRIQDSFPRGGEFFGRGVQIQMLVSTSSKGGRRGLEASEYREKCSTMP